MRYIYIVQNKTNNKVYVGQSKVPHKRWIRHQYDANVRQIILPLYNSIRKYGMDNFTFSIIEEWDDNDIDEAEVFWIEYFRSWDANYGYNLDLGGCKNKIVSQESRNKQSISAKKNYTPEVQSKLRESRGTPESRAKTVLQTTGVSNPRAKITETIVKQIRQLWETGQYKQTELSEKFNLPKPTVNHIIKRYTWKHI